MAYRQPGVTVFQEFTGATPALALFNLPNVNVGPAFQVVKQGAAGDYVAVSATYAYPGQIAGSLVDIRLDDPLDLISYAAKIELKNTVIEFATASTGTVSSGALNQFSDGTSGAFTDVVAGDVIVVTGSGVGNNGAYTVRSKTSANLLVVNETFAAAQTGIAYSVRRNIQSTDGTIEITRDTAGVTVTQDNVTLPAALTYDHATLGTCPIVSGKVLISYRAQRLEKSADVFEYTTVQDLQADFGTDQIVPENPLAFAAYLALNNSAPSTNVLACDYQFLNDEVLSYADAFTVLERTDMYCINVLTQNTAIHTALSAHVNLMSDPYKKLERVGITNRRLITSAVVVDQITTSGSEGITGSSGGPYTTLNSANSHFLTDGVVPGMFVNVLAPSGVVARYEIAAVNSQTKLTLVDGAVTSATGVTFAIEKDLTKNDQATYISAYAASIGNRRLVVTWPDIVKIPVGADIRELPGYFLGCAIGALTTFLPTQQGLTNQSVAVYTGVKHSTKYFSNEQLNTMANGGVMIFVQNIIDVTALYIRHQLTSDRSAVKFQEYSITKNVDFIAKFIRSNHASFPGKYNIVDNAFDDLKANAAGIVLFLRDRTKKPKIGGVIKSGKLLSCVQDPSAIDAILERWSLDIPIPLNNLDITIVV